MRVGIKIRLGLNYQLMYKLAVVTRVVPRDNCSSLVLFEKNHTQKLSSHLWLGALLWFYTTKVYQMCAVICYTGKIANYVVRFSDALASARSILLLTFVISACAASTSLS